MPSPVGGLEACPQKKKFCAKNYAILSKFWYFFPVLQQKVGDYPPVLKVGDLSPFSDAYAEVLMYGILLIWILQSVQSSTFPCMIHLDRACSDTDQNPVLVFGLVFYG